MVDGNICVGKACGRLVQVCQQGDATQVVTGGNALSVSTWTDERRPLACGSTLACVGAKIKVWEAECQGCPVETWRPELPRDITA